MIDPVPELAHAERLGAEIGHRGKERRAVEAGEIGLALFAQGSIRAAQRLMPQALSISPSACVNPTSE